jgi:peptidoglycan-N-acetylglucosamine deacetylase
MQPLTLTFDDGPDPVWTPEVLKALQRFGVKGTFFLVGEKVKETPWLASAISAAGHEIGLHCHRHIRHSDLTEREIDRDTHAALEVFAQVGVTPEYWRTPWGVCTQASFRVAERHGLKLVRWSIETYDWRGRKASAMFNRVARRLAEGQVVLMHDAVGPGALRQGCKETVLLVTSLLNFARARGLQVGPLSAEEDHRDLVHDQRLVGVGQRAGDRP